MDYTQIAVAVEEGVQTITLDRPERLNAYTTRMGEELLAAFDAADRDDGVRAVIVTGAGRGFCAGADLGRGGATFDYRARGEEPGAQVKRDGGGRLTLRIFECLKPVIAAVNGPAVGVGATMLLPMDVRIASEDARFGFVFTRRGLVPEACSSWFLPRLVGISQAMQWVASGRVFPAGEALAGGLAQQVVPAADLAAAARAKAKEMTEQSSAVAVALARQMLWRMLGEAHPMAAHRVDSRGISAMGRSADAREGVTAFLEKRPARYTMRPSADMPDFYPWWDEPRYR